jgi:hypothetical protein
MRATRVRSLARSRIAPRKAGKTGREQPRDKPQARSGPQARSTADLVRLLGLPGAAAAETLLHLQLSAGNSAASGLLREVNLDCE